MISSVLRSALQVLRGATNLLNRICVVESEVEFVPLYVNQPLFADVDAELRARSAQQRRE